MSILTPGGLPRTDRLGNAVQPDFRNMIRLETLLDDPDFNDREKLRLSLGLLYGAPSPCRDEDALKELRWFYSCGKENAAGEAHGRNIRLYDFEEDAECIYSAFFSAYNIDLTAAALHWWQFMALFIQLPENTLMSQKIYYRGVDISGLKGEQRKSCELKKKAFALKKKTVVAETLQELEARRLEYVNRRFAEAERQMKGVLTDSV